MPRPIPVYIVPKPSFGGQVIVALLIFGLAVALLKLAIIAALGLGALYLVLRVMLAAPGLLLPRDLGRWPVPRAPKYAFDGRLDGTLVRDSHHDPRTRR